MSEDLSGFSMMDLFRMEAETHTAALTEGLLELEENPDAWFAKYLKRTETGS